MRLKSKEKRLKMQWKTSKHFQRNFHILSLKDFLATEPRDGLDKIKKKIEKGIEMIQVVKQKEKSRAYLFQKFKAISSFER